MSRVRLGLLSAVLVAIAACSDDTAPTGEPPPASTAPPLTSTTPTTPAPSPTSSTSTTSTTATTTPPDPPSPPTVNVVPVAQVTDPVALAVRPQDRTLYLVEKHGVITAVRDGTVEPVPRLDITDAVSTGGEQGLLGLAFHPSDATAYVNYTDTSGDTVIAEYAVGNDGMFDPASARTVLTVDQPYANHNGGTIAFGPDGLLYIGMGDGGSGGDPERRALDLSTLLGKMLRIDPRATATQPYQVPADNPFLATAGARPEIWSTGLRNPWRFSFDTATGDLWIGDVGQREWEEIDVAWADEGTGRGASFGWSAYEAGERFNSDQPADGHVAPFFSYDHSEGCSVSGGVRYRGSAIPALAGWYVFSDYCAGVLRAVEVVGRSAGRHSVLAEGIGGVTAVSSGPDGEVYVLTLDGAVFQMTV